MPSSMAVTMLVPKKVGIDDIAGLGHMGVKLAKAMGPDVIVFTISISKFEDAKRLFSKSMKLVNAF